MDSTQSPKPVAVTDRETLGRLAYEGFPYTGQAAWNDPYNTDSEREGWRQEGESVALAVCPPGYVVVPLEFVDSVREFLAEYTADEAYDPQNVADAAFDMSLHLDMIDGTFPEIDE